MAKYIICPRCELNFIDEEKQEFCDVCLNELNGKKNLYDNMDEEDIAEETELCPICGENYMRSGEKMCDECKKKTEYEDEVTEENESDETWRTYMDDEDSEEDIGVDLSAELDADDEEEEEEEEPVQEEKDDFEYVSVDDYDPDEDDEDDDDDFDDDFSGKKKNFDDDDDF